VRSPVTDGAEGFDAHDNSLGDYTSATTFTIGGAASSCTGATCTSTLPGGHTVTGTSGGISGKNLAGVRTSRDSGPRASGVTTFMPGWLPATDSASQLSLEVVN
jgi:hypothetical protein